MLDDKMVAAWREAASRVGVRVVGPHSLELADGTILTVEARWRPDTDDLKSSTFKTR